MTRADRIRAIGNRSRHDVIAERRAVSMPAAKQVVSPSPCSEARSSSGDLPAEVRRSSCCRLVNIARERTDDAAADANVLAASADVSVAPRSVADAQRSIPSVIDVNSDWCRRCHARTRDRARMHAVSDTKHLAYVVKGGLFRPPAPSSELVGPLDRVIGPNMFRPRIASRRCFPSTLGAKRSSVSGSLRPPGRSYSMKHAGRLMSNG